MAEPEAITNKYSSRRCAVFGSNGYLGCHLATALMQEGHQVTGYDVHGQPVIPSLSHVRMDITEEQDWNRFDPDVDVIYFFSGLTGTHLGFAQWRQYLAVNEGGLLALCDTLRKSGSTARVVFPSTRLVYKGNNLPLDEDAEKETKTVYAVNKLACEGMLQAYNASFGIPYVVFRICVPYGTFLPMPYSYGTVGALLRTAREGQPIQLFGDGRQRRTVTHVQDICLQIIKLSLMPDMPIGVYNVGGEDYSIKDLAEIIAGKFGVSVVHRDWPEADLKLESGSTVFNDAKVQQVCACLRRFSFKEWVASL